MMAREVEYRAWIYDPLNSDVVPKMVYQVGLKHNGLPLFGYEMENAGKVELMLYTGVKDKNGVKIFVGDILKGYDGRLYVVVFPPGGGFYMDWYDKAKREGSRQIISDYYNGVVYTGPSISVTPDGKTVGDERIKEHTPEIVGNKFENPEFSWVGDGV